MKTIKLTPAAFLPGGGSYESPEVSVTEIHAEGVLCVSERRGSSNEDWEEADSFSWDEE